MAQAKLLNLKQEIAKIDTQTLLYMGQLPSGSAKSAVNSIIQTVLISRELTPKEIKVRG